MTLTPGVRLGPYEVSASLAAGLGQELASGERGQKQPVSTRGGIAPTWAPDNHALFYLNQTSISAGPTAMIRVAMESDGTTLKPGPPEQLFEWRYYDTPGRHRRYDVAANGRFLVITDVDGLGPNPTFDLIVTLNWIQELKARVPTGR